MPRLRNSTSADGFSGSSPVVGVVKKLKEGILKTEGNRRQVVRKRGRPVFGGNFPLLTAIRSVITKKESEPKRKIGRKASKNMYKR